MVIENAVCVLVTWTALLVVVVTGFVHTSVWHCLVAHTSIILVQSITRSGSDMKDESFVRFCSFGSSHEGGPLADGR